MAIDAVIDTTVLQKANAPVSQPPRQGSQFQRRLALLRCIGDRSIRCLISAKLLAEYRKQIPEPRNDFIRAFFDLLSRADGAIPNWRKPWSGANLDTAVKKCRFPHEDIHVLRTAARPKDSATIFSEEGRMIAADACIHRHFRVHIQNPVADGVIDLG